MNKTLFGVLLVLMTISSMAQTLNDCSSSYVQAYKLAKRLQFEKKITEAEADKRVADARAILDSCIIGKEVNDFHLTGLSGAGYSKDAMMGKVVLFNFWSVYCGPCIAEIPVLNRIVDDYKDKDFVLISVLIDKKEDFSKMLERGIVKRKVYFDVIPDSKGFIKSDFGFAALALPTNLFVDRNGKVFHKVVGSSESEAYESFLRELIDSKLAEQ